MKQILLFFLFILNSYALEEISRVSFWDNSLGFVQGENCELIRKDSTDFRFTKYHSGNPENIGSLPAENMRDIKGNFTSALKNYSLVALINDEARRNYKVVTVIGVNDIDLPENYHGLTEAGDRGNIYQHSLISPDGFTFQFVENELLTNDQVKGMDFNQIYFNVVKVGSDYFDIRCDNTKKDREYSLLSISIKDQEGKLNIVGYVGLTKFESRLFRTIKTLEGEDVVSLSEEDISESILESFELPTENDNDEDADEEAPEKNETNSEVSNPSNWLSNGIGYFSGSMEHIVCYSPNSGSINVRDDNLKVQSGVKAKGGERVAKYSSWNGEKKSMTIKGNKVEFVKVKFLGTQDGDEKFGWIASKFYQLRSKCKYSFSLEQEKTEIEHKTKGLGDSSCCIFPVAKKPTETFKSKSVQTSFGYGRGWKDGKATRKHGACDLYRYEGEPVYAVASGVVERAYFNYYQGTYGVKIHHDGGFTVIYGELTGKTVNGIVGQSKDKDGNIIPGTRVKAGTRIGYIGKVNSGCCEPMLHFELYDKHFQGASNGDNIYNRNESLIDPTDHLDRWMQKIFSTNEKERP